MPRLCIVTALPAETRPLLDALKLRQSNARHLRLYSSETYFLLETGPGKLNAAACVGALLQLHPNINGIVNVGIAGGDFDYSQILAAHHICDHASGAQWFPHLPDNKVFKTIKTASVTTIDKPNTEYRDGLLFDMEAAGIFSAASRQLSTSQIHSIKVVSDNAECSINNITRNIVLELITRSLPTLVPMLDAIQTQNLGIQFDTAVMAEELINNTIAEVRHSVNDTQLLRQLVQRHIALTAELPPIDKTQGTAKSIRQALNATLAAQPFVYGEH